MGCGGGEGAQHILWVSFVYHYSFFPVARHATWGMRLLVDMRVHMLVWGCCSRCVSPALCLPSGDVWGCLWNGRVVGSFARWALMRDASL